MTKKALKELYLKRLPKITKAIARNYKPEKIILFGSLAGGKMSEACDIDLFLVKETKKRHSERVREVRDFIPADVPIDIIIYTPKELKEALKIGSYFAEDILSEGKVLYETQK